MPFSGSMLHAHMTEVAVDEPEMPASPIRGVIALAEYTRDVVRRRAS